MRTTFKNTRTLPVLRTASRQKHSFTYLNAAPVFDIDPLSRCDSEQYMHLLKRLASNLRCLDFCYNIPRLQITFSRSTPCNDLFHAKKAIRL